ncbi:MAG: class I SAM-dependent methyltransferase [Chthoniobacter sp.]|uniref:class I SAM-dependent methyltransferase n=1 Tax=Chthoniobacter sp. TaxID=2510640 RepID=UPI0032A96864
MSNLPSWDPIWERIFSTQEWGKYPPEQVIRFVARNFYKAPDRKQVKLLDLGGGTGACTWFMAREGFDVSSIDGQRRQCGSRASDWPARTLSQTFGLGNFTQLPWPDQHFDGVIDNGSLFSNRFGQCQRAVAEVWRVLKQDGRFLSCSMTNESWGYGLGVKVEHNTFRDIPVGPFQNRGLILLMDRPQIDELFSIFAEVSVEKATWTTDNMQHRMDWWLVEARKAS